MDDKKRYNKPVTIGDILSDMGIYNQNIQQVRRNFSEDIINIMNIYAKLIESMNTIYQKANILINNMDQYYAHEKNNLVHTKQSIEQDLLTQVDIKTRMRIILDDLNQFEKEYIYINRLLAKTIKQFSDTKDKREQIKKINDLHELFINIHIDISDIVIQYSSLLSSFSA